MLLSEYLKSIKEDAAPGAISATSIATNSYIGFAKDKRKIIKRKKIKSTFKENVDQDKTTVMAQIKNSEVQANANNDVVGFALEDEDGNIVKIYVKKDQAKEFETTLNLELSKNQQDEHSHREIGEIIFDLKNDFDIVNIQMGTIPEDEEEIEEIKSNNDDSKLELNDKDDIDKDDIDKDDIDKDMMPLSDAIPSNTSDNSNVKSALDSVIDMMKADAEARKAEAEAKEKESEAKIASLNTQSAEAQVKKSEEIMDMEAYNDKQSTKDKEAKQIQKLAKYRHELDQSDIEPNTDYIETDIPSEEEEVVVTGKFLNKALQSLLRDRASRN